MIWFLGMVLAILKHEQRRNSACFVQATSSRLGESCRSSSTV